MRSGTAARPSSGSELLAHFGRAWRAWRSERKAIDALHRLDDRELRDIGIDRSEITAAVRGTLRSVRG